MSTQPHNKSLQNVESTRGLNVWVVAAGTGGHIFPGLNIVNQIKKQFPQAEFLFFGDPGRLESRIVPSHGYKIKFLSSARWKGSGLPSRLSGFVSIFVGMCQALLQTIKKKPDLLLSVGGYVSVPVALACIMRRVPLYILEPNIRSGMANRFLSKFARAVFTTEGSDALQKMKCPVYKLGNPVRKDLKPVVIRPDVKQILVLGGSQGALSLCRVALHLMSDSKIQDAGIQLFLQCGEKNLEQSMLWQKELEVEAWSTVVSFINDVPQALDKADLVIARAGAMTVAELALAGLPTIFIPYPHAADNHQRVNAELLFNDHSARLVDETQDEFEEELRAQVHELCLAPNHFNKRKRMHDNFQKWGKPQAAEDIVKKIITTAGLT